MRSDAQNFLKSNPSSFILPHFQLMIDFVKGAIAFKTPTYIVIETSGGVGYHVNISLHTYAQIEKLETVRLLTHLQVREDAHILFGFADESERKMFRLLIEVSGIGTSTAQVVLSSMNPDEVRVAILNESEVTFSRVKGIGLKTAKRIILDLKDKVKREQGDTTLNLAGNNNTTREDALLALSNLGFQRIPIQRAINKILEENMSASVQEVIKKALQMLS